MKPFFICIILFTTLIISCSKNEKSTQKDEERFLPTYLIGDFEDDYEIKYSISDSTFILLPDDVYHIKRWDLENNFLIALNDSANEYDPGLWTRIDWIELEDMEPFEWAFCLSVYNAPSAIEAENSANIDPSTPRTGCNGFPFSRMKRVQNIDSVTNSY